MGRCWWDKLFYVWGPQGSGKRFKMKKKNRVSRSGIIWKWKQDPSSPFIQGRSAIQRVLVFKSNGNVDWQEWNYADARATARGQDPSGAASMGITCLIQSSIISGIRGIGVIGWFMCPTPWSSWSCVSGLTPLPPSLPSYHWLPHRHLSPISQLSLRTVGWLLSPIPWRKDRGVFWAGGRRGMFSG